MARPSIARLVWRRLYWLQHDWPYRALFRHAKRAFYFPGGLGDELLCTIPAQEYMRRGQGRSIVFSHASELFAQNPAIAGVVAPEGGAFAAWHRTQKPLFEPMYNQSVPGDMDREIPPVLPIQAEICRASRLAGEVELRPWFYVSDAELAVAECPADALALQVSVNGAKHPYQNKEWPIERWRDLARRLAVDHPVIQVGASADPELGVGTDLRGRTNIRQLGTVLAQCRLFVGLVGFCMHLARAVETQGVIIYGGREHPEQSGYPCNENLYIPEPCAPCWRKNGCEFGRRCLDRISTDDVIEAINRQLCRPRGPLASRRLSVTD